MDTELKTRFVKQANLFLSYCLPELQNDLQRMSEKGLDQDLIDKRTNVINQMVDFYNVANDVVNDLDTALRLCNFSNKLLEGRLLKERQEFVKEFSQIADMIKVNDK